ncbi:MAG: TIR domain-containing protein [Paracoccaceae bacterium]|jgi:hypothetical protein
MATVNIFRGDMFARPCDLIVIPCSTVPTISQFVYERLEQFNLPMPSSSMALGQVLFVETHSIEQVSSQIAYAATVQGAASEYDAIRDVIICIAKHCNENRWLTDVSTPILGTGAGGLDHKLSLIAMAEVFLQECKTDAKLNVYSLMDIPEDWLSLLKEPRKNGPVRVTKARVKFPQLIETTEAHGKAIQPPRVFISYSHSSEDHKKWTKELATKLRTHGIDARIDQFHLSRADEIANWMNRELTLADKVIIICDTVYYQKFEGRTGGASWEATMILGDIYRHQTERRHVGIQVHSDADQCVPMFLRGRYNFRAVNYDLDQIQFAELIEFLFDIEPEAPQLGSPPPEILRRLQTRGV